MFTLFTLYGFPVRAHWSLILTFPFAWYMSTDVLVGLTVSIAFMLLMIVHELGHALMAIRHHCEVLYIELYPLHGICCIDEPEESTSEIYIAWGGVLGQGVLLLLFVIIVWLLNLFDIELNGSGSGIVAVMIPINLVLIVINLWPYPSLDGEVAWKIFPILISDLKKRKNDRTPQPVKNKNSKVVDMKSRRNKER